jgi:hypothetical protein
MNNIDGNRPSKRPKYDWEDNINMAVKGIV